ncbi:MAG: LytR C-terminal domain-containing protein [Fidelibacterota bacterium]
MARKGRSTRRTTWLDLTIAFLGLVFLVFVISMVQRTWRGGSIPLAEGPGPGGRDSGSSPFPPRLIVDYREEVPASPMEVEVLNGCGVYGLAAGFTDFLRTEGFDVVNSGNANNFDYPATLIIQRSERVESSYRMAELLNIPKSDTTRILVRPDLSLATDVTVILGRDYKDIKPFRQFLSTRP